MSKKPNRAGDHKLMLALACGATVEKAAHEAGISEATAYRRLADPAFKRAISNLRSDMVQRTSGMMTAMMLESAKTLMRLQKPTEKANVQLAAAKANLEIAMKLREATDLEERMAALEALQVDKNP